MSEWNVDQQYLSYLLQLLTAATNMRDTVQQAQLTKALDDFHMLPESDNYFLIVLTGGYQRELASSNGNINDETIRSMAGLVLKNSFKRRKVLPQSTLGFFKTFGLDTRGGGVCALLQSLCDPHPLVRNTVGTVISAIATRLGKELGRYWPELLPLLINMTNDPSAAEAVTSTLAKICEDSGEYLAQDPTNPLDALISHLIALAATEQSSVQVCINCLTTMNHLLFYDNTMEEHVESLLQVLSNLATSEKGTRMRKTICQSINGIHDFYPETLVPIMAAVMQYMLENLQMRQDESVSLEACEFWLAFVERDSASDFIGPFLSRLLAVLMENIVYTDDDPDLDANREEENLGAMTLDRAQDIKPRHHKVAQHGEEVEAGELSEEEQKDKDKNGEDGGDDDDDLGSWNLRKCSGATIDVLASSCAESTFVPLILPLINEKLSNSNWKHREAGILALGAIAEGCMESMLSHLPQIIPFLLQNIESNNGNVPLVRAITAWTLSRYASWIETLDLNVYVIEGILSAMKSPNKKVQNAACTALRVFAEKAKSTTSGALSNVAKALQFGLLNYQANNLIVLYDVIGVIADEIGDELAVAAAIPNSGILHELMPLLMNKWIGTKEESLLLALLECMCSLCIAVGAQLGPFANSIYQRAILIVGATLKMAALSNDEVDYGFAIAALDLIGGLVQGLGDRMQIIIDNTLSTSNPSLLSTLLYQALNSEMADLRQAAFALVGDMAQNCPVPLFPLISNGAFVKAALVTMDIMSEDNSQGAANNAVWSLGEAFLKFPKELSSAAVSTSAILCRLVQYEVSSFGRGYLENVAVALGRCLGLCQTPPPEFWIILGKWAIYIDMVSNLVERETAWNPVVSLLMATPVLIRPETIHPLLKSIAHFKRPPHHLETAFSTLVMMIRNQIVGPSNWHQFRITQLADIPIEFERRFGLPLSSS